MIEADRYADKPLIKLLECYVLHAIGELDRSEYAVLREMTPKLRMMYNCSGEWDGIIALAMEFPANMPHEIKLVWLDCQRQATTRGVQLSSTDFARTFVEQNFL